MPAEQQETGRDPKVEDLTYLWTEYTYRHELCWKAIYKLTAAVIALGILPYVNDRLMAALGGAMLVPSVVGTLLALYGIFVVNNELRLFARTKVAHNDMRNRFLTDRIIDPSVQWWAIDPLVPKHARWTYFDVYAHLLMVVLFVISLGNATFLFDCWMQHGSSCFPSQGGAIAA